MNWTYVGDVGFARYFVRGAIRRLTRSVFRTGLSCRLPTGLRIGLPADSAFASEVFVTGADVDWGAEALFARHINPAADMIDAGANIGYYALYMAPCAHHVWAFEPDPRVLPVLRANAARAGNVTVIDSALYSTPGRMTLETGGGSEVNRLAGDGAVSGSSIEVEVTTIDAFTAAQGGIRTGAIKIDVEGADIAVLEGARATVARDQPLVLTEFNLGEGSNDAGRLDRLVAEFEYGMFGFVRTGRRSPRFELRRLAVGDVAAGRCKMIFLVPPRLGDAFAAEAR